MIFSSKLGLQTMLLLCRQLATSHSAGIPILKSFEIITRNTHSGRLRNVISRMSTSIEAGSTLEQASREQSRYLPSLFVELVGAGEMSGRLDEIFDSLAGYYERTLDLVRRMRGKMIYPIILITLLLLVMNFWLAILRAVTGAGSVDFNKLIRVFVQNMGWLGLILAGAFVVLVVLSRLGILGWIFGFVSTFLWPFSGLTRRLALSRFARAFGLLLRSGVPVTDALTKSAVVTNNLYIERSLLRCLPAIQSGESLSVALSPCRYLSDLAREMIHSGEQAGRVDQHLEKVADIHQAEAMQAAKNLVVVMGVLLLLAAAIAIAIFVIIFWTRYYGAMFEELGI